MFAQLALISSVLSITAVTGHSVLSAGQSMVSHRTKRQLWDFNVVQDTATCKATLDRVSAQCQVDIEYKVRNIARDSDHESERCCAFTQVQKCIRDRSSVDCGPGTTYAMEQAVERVTKGWASDCGNYDYYSATCLFFVWYTYVTLAAIAILVLCCCCCVCCLKSCCCCC